VSLKPQFYSHFPVLYIKLCSFTNFLTKLFGKEVVISPGKYNKNGDAYRNFGYTEI